MLALPPPGRGDPTIRPPDEPENVMHHTQEPIPKMDHYERSYNAARRGRWGRARRIAAQLGAAGWISAAAVIGIAAVAVQTVLHDDPARAAADRAAVIVATPTATVGIPVPQATVAGDGMWLVGSQIRPGVYQSNAGASCYWERLAGLSGKYEDLIDNGGLRRGPKLVEVKASDYAFSSQRCGQWVKIR